MAAAVLTITDGNSDNDINLLDDTGLHVSAGGLESISLPNDGKRFAIRLDAKSDTSVDDMLLNVNKIERILRTARMRQKRSWRPIVVLEYKPADATTTNQKFVYGGVIDTSPFEGVASENAAGRRTMRSMRLILQVEPYWRGATVVLNNLVDNSDFEWDKVDSTALPTGWTQNNTAATTEGMAITNVKYGRQCYRWNLGASGTGASGIYQDITVVADSGAYSFSVWVTPVSGTAYLQLHDGAGGNIQSAGSSGTTLQELKIEGYTLTPTTQTTIRVLLIRNAVEASDFYWDSIMGIEASTMPAGYIAGGTFDNQDTTLIAKNGTVIVADLKGDASPLVRIAVENPTSGESTAYRRCWMGNHRLESGDDPLQFCLDAVDNSQDSTDVVELGAQPDLDGHHIEKTGATDSYDVLGSLTEEIEGPGASIPLSIDGPTLDTDPKRYRVFGRIANVVLIKEFKLKTAADNVLVHKKNIAISGASGVDLDLVDLGQAWIPHPAAVNQGANKDFGMDIMWDIDSASKVQVDCLWFFPADEGFCRLEQSQRESNATWSTNGTWESGAADFLVLEDITDPERPRYGVADTYNTWNNEKAWDFRGKVPQFGPNMENRLCVFVQRDEDWARLDQTFKIRLDYIPRYLTPRGD